jgi:hypothetical protein
MLPDRIVDLQHWDTNSGAILNHLVESGWQPGTMPYGIDPDEPIPEIQSDHETLPEPASQPPLREKALNPARAPQPPLTPPKAPQAAAPQRRAPAQVQQPEIPICVLPNPDLAKRSVRKRETEERSDRLFASICGWTCLLVFLFLIGRFSSGSAGSNPPLQSTIQIPDTAAASVVVRRALPAVPRAVPVLTSDDKPVARAQLVVVPRAQLVRLP